MLQDLCVSHQLPVSLYYDNVFAIHIAANPIFHERTEHIELDCHLVREKSISGLIHLLPVSSINQLADIYTKALVAVPFHASSLKLEICNIHSPVCGGSVRILTKTYLFWNLSEIATSLPQSF